MDGWMDGWGRLEYFNFSLCRFLPNLSFLSASSSLGNAHTEEEREAA
jgi:hypothetical protein